MNRLARARAGPGDPPSPPGGTWARFGDEVVVLGPEAGWQQAERAARKAGLRLEGLPHRGRRERLHVVVQHGRLFQARHPRVPVLVDRGRFLLVDLDPRRAPQLARAHPSGYGVLPLRDGHVVFDVADRAALRAARSAAVQAAVDGVSRAGVEAALTRLVSWPTRLSTSPEYRQAAAWARKTLAGLGYRVRDQQIAVGTRASRNVIADGAGHGPDGQRGVMVVTAHLDSINHAGGAAAPAPGADDNGTGSAGVLEMARGLADQPRRHDLRLILFGGEEQGLLGSQRYLAALPAAERARIRAVVNMDMIGGLNQATPAVLLEGAPVARRVMDGLARAAATYTRLRVERSLDPFASDHVPFIRAGVPAVLTIEGADTANTAIHSPRDTLDRIDYGLLLDVLRMNVAFVAEELAAE